MGVDMQTDKKYKNTGEIDWSVLEEHWANDYNDVYAPKE